MLFQTVNEKQNGFIGWLNSNLCWCQADIMLLMLLAHRKNKMHHNKHADLMRRVCMWVTEYACASARVIRDIVLLRNNVNQHFKTIIKIWNPHKIHLSFPWDIIQGRAHTHTHQNTQQIALHRAKYTHKHQSYWHPPVNEQISHTALREKRYWEMLPVWKKILEY